MKFMASGVTFSAAMVRSPSSSLLASSTTTTILPCLRSSKTDEIELYTICKLLLGHFLGTLANVRLNGLTSKNTDKKPHVCQKRDERSNAHSKPKELDYKIRHYVSDNDNAVHNLLAVSAGSCEQQRQKPGNRKQLPAQ